MRTNSKVENLWAIANWLKGAKVLLAEASQQRASGFFETNHFDLGVTENMDILSLTKSLVLLRPCLNFKPKKKRCHGETIPFGLAYYFYPKILRRIGVFLKPWNREHGGINERQLFPAKSRIWWCERSQKWGAKVSIHGIDEYVEISKYMCDGWISVIRY